jgi:hypothetical protein
MNLTNTEATIIQACACHDVPGVTHSHDGTWIVAGLLLAIVLFRRFVGTR